MVLTSAFPGTPKFTVSDLRGIFLCGSLSPENVCNCLLSATLMWSCVKSVPLGAAWEGAWLGGNAKI